MSTPSPTLREAQGQVDEWIQTIGVRYFSELTNLAILTEEVGELARIMARRFGDQSEKPSDRGADLGQYISDGLVETRAPGYERRVVREQCSITPTAGRKLEPISISQAVQ